MIPLLNCVDLSFSYDQRNPVFKNLSLIVHPGEAVWVQGANGVGKSTLLKVISGILPRQSGKIQITALLRYVPCDKNQLWLNLSAHRNVLFQTKFFKDDSPETTADEHLRFWGIPKGMASLPARFLSTGSKKKLALTSLLCGKSKLWILDEPFSGLDQNSQEKLQMIIKEHLFAKGSLIFTRHETEGVHFDCRIMKLDGGLHE